MDKLKRKFEVAACWKAFPIWLLVIWLFSQSSTGAELYGRIAPAVTPITITSIEATTVHGAPGSRIAGYADIERGSCDYLYLEWDLHGTSKSARVTAFFEDAAQVREEGTQYWQALMIGIPPHKLAESTGLARHQCGLFPVLSPFYLPDDSIIPTDAGATAQCHSGAYTTSTGPGTCSGHGGVEEWFTQ